MEAIAAIHARIAAVRAEGRVPESIVIPVPLYRLIQKYRATLGEARNEDAEYIGKYQLFGLPILADQSDRIVVRTRPKT